MSLVKTGNEQNLINSHSVVGKSVPRSDSLAKATGKAKYTADLYFDNVLHAKVVRVPCAHAQIKRVNLEKTLQLEGVVATLTADDLSMHAMEKTWVPVLARDKVRSYADGVAIVAAESEQIAMEGAKLADIEYQELPQVFDVNEAKNKQAPQIHECGNVYEEYSTTKGNINTGFNEADVVVEKTYTVPLAEHAYLEPESAVGVYEPDGTITVYGSIKSPFTVRKMVAKILNTSFNSVKIVPVTLGGYFGGKDEDMAVMATRVALMAKKTGRPVMISYSREESILDSTKRHLYEMKYTVGAKLNGQITAMNIDVLADIGAYSVKSSMVVFRSLVEASGPYVIPNANIKISCVFTNNNNNGAFRGFGSPQVNFACESIIDELAQELDMDPLELRLINALDEGSETVFSQKLHAVSVKQCLQEAASKSSWESLRNNTGNDQKRRGIGVSAAFRGVSLGGDSIDTATAIISIQDDAMVLFTCGIIEGGQGSKTVFEQMCAEALGIDLDMVKFVDWNTDMIPDCGVTSASRGTLVGGNAIKDGCEQLLGRIFAVVAQEHNMSRSELFIRDGVIRSSQNPSFDISFEEAVAMSRRAKTNLTVVGYFSAPNTGIDNKTGKGKPFFDYVYGANIAEVEVDVSTGAVEVLNFTSVHDVGKAVNPELLKGQIYGGITMALGTTLLEEYIFTEKYPQILNLDKYLIPTVKDIGNYNAVIIENDFENGPYGASSIGEPANQAASPAIINAIAHATGKRIRDLPAIHEKVFLNANGSEDDSK